MLTKALIIIIHRNTPQIILENYHELIGKPFLPPYWSFGNHYTGKFENRDNLKEIAKKYIKSNFPIESIFLNTEYMDNFNPFTVNKEKFPDLQGLLRWLHLNNIKLIPSFLPQIPSNPYNFAYQTVLIQNVLLKTHDCSYFTGITQAGKSHFIDFIHPNSTKFWNILLQFFAKNISLFDGASLEQNTVSQFCNGDCKNQKEKLDEFIYLPGGRNLEHKTLPLNLQHYFSTEQEKLINTEKNLHPMFGYFQTKSTNDYFSQRNLRGLILSQNTFSGSGKFAGHIIFSNQNLKNVDKSYEKWEKLRLSVTQIFLMQMFGISLSGPQICESDDIELCQRWYQLAIFFPIFINTNDIFQSNELRETAKICLLFRYSLIRFFYSLQFKVSLYGGTYFNPLFYEYPHDIFAYTETESFLIGNGLKITPVLHPNKQNVTTYFPNNNWYNLMDGKQILESRENTINGSFLILNSSLESNIINVHIRGGNIIPIQFTDQNDENKIHNTGDLTLISTSLIIALDGNLKAKGYVVYDEGEGPFTLMHREYHWFEFNVAKGKLFIDLVANQKYVRSMHLEDESLDKIIIYGARRYEKIKEAEAFCKDGRMIKMIGKYEKETEKLEFKFENDAVELIQIHTIVWDWT